MSDLNINGEVNGVSTVEIFATKVGEKKKTLKSLPTAKLVMDLARNPRKRNVYADDNNQKLARNIVDYGLQSPIVVNIRENGVPIVLCGHRRLIAIRTYQTEGLKAVKGNEGKQPALAADPKFLTEVPCIVYQGLTLEEEMDLVMDHGPVLLLTEQEKFMAAKAMIGVGFNHAFIADKLGMSRANFTNFFAKLIKLPDVVQEAFLSDDEKAPKITQETAKALEKAYAEDQKAPNAVFKVGGDKFNAEWDRVVSQGSTPRVKMLTVEKLEQMASVLNRSTDSDLMDLLIAITKGNMQGAQDAVNRIRNLINAGNSTVNTGVTRIEEGIATTVGDYVPVVDSTY